MLDEKMIQECKKRVEQGLRDEKIIKEKEGKFIVFFLENAKNSLDTSQVLWDISTSEKPNGINRKIYLLTDKTF